MSEFCPDCGKPRELQPVVAISGQTRSYRIVKELPRELKGQLPSPAEISKLLEDVK